MLLIPKNLRAVVLECPYDSWEDPTARRLFGEIIGLKLKGYGQEYPYGVLPMDTYDFIASHQMVCEEVNGELRPLMGYKSVTLARCRLHHLPFPALSLLKSSPSDTHLHQQTLTAILDRCDREQIQISYGSSWTIRPEIRKQNRELAGLLKDMMTGIMVHHHAANGIRELIGCGVLRFKTDRYFQEFGYVPFESASRPLPSFDLTSLLGENVNIMHCLTPSAKAIELGKRFAPFWENRLMISAPRPERTQKQAA